MSLIKMIKERSNESFINAKVAGAGQLSPRNGYYFIREITFRPVGLNGEVPIAKVNWKATLEEIFYEDVISEIALLSLRSANPNVSKEIDYNNLIGSTVLIYDAGIVQQIVNGNAKPILDCKYCVIAIDSIFTTTQTEVLQSFFGNAKTLSEAYHSFEKGLGIDLSGALEWEAAFGEVYDEPTSDDDAYDAPWDDNEDLNPTN